MPIQSFGDIAKTLKPVQQQLTSRNQWEDLLNQIVEQTDEKDKKKFAGLLAIQARTLRLSETDLHYLLQKKKDPTIRSYTGFIKWSFGLCKKK